MAPHRLKLTLQPSPKPPKPENTSAVQDESSTNLDSTPNPEPASPPAPKKKTRAPKQRSSKQKKSKSTVSNQMPPGSSPRRSGLRNESEISSLDLGSSSTQGNPQSEILSDPKSGFDLKFGLRATSSAETSQSIRLDDRQSQSVTSAPGTAATKPSSQQASQPSKAHPTAAAQNAPAPKPVDKPAGKPPVVKADMKPVPVYGDLHGFGYGYGFAVDEYNYSTDDFFGSAIETDEDDLGKYFDDLDEVNKTVQDHELSLDLFPDVKVKENRADDDEH